mmetsp:Transcript_11845/g.26321  ORF Transcript_11845/g.26321 Transcript_11845/m.26321 type:complete len:389 (+) Transcript_11845:539-1705(+)
MGVRPMLATGTLQEMVTSHSPRPLASLPAGLARPSLADVHRHLERPSSPTRFPSAIAASPTDSCGEETPCQPAGRNDVVWGADSVPDSRLGTCTADVGESQEAHCGKDCCPICFLEFDGERCPVQKSCCRNEVCNVCYEKSRSRMCFFCRHDNPTWPALQPPAAPVEPRRADIVAQQDAIALARAEQERHLERQRQAWAAIQNSQESTAKPDDSCAPTAGREKATASRSGRALVPRVSSFIYGAQLEILEGLGADPTVCKDLLLNHYGDVHKCVNDLVMLGVIDASAVDSQPRQIARKRTTLDVVNSRLGGSKHTAPQKSRQRLGAAPAVVHRPVPAFVYGVQLADLLDRGYDEELCRDLLTQYHGSLHAVLSTLSELGIAPQRRGPR